MNINIFPIVSSLHQKNKIDKYTEALLNELFVFSKHNFKIVDVDNLYDADLSLILIQSGGSEQLFLENFNKLKEPYYLLTYGNNNSLAASLEILSFLKDNNLDGEVLHGDVTYLTKRINELLNKDNKTEKIYRYGVIGKPSDWLIASNVNYTDAKKIHNINLIDIDINELINLYNTSENIDFNSNLNFDKNEINYSLKLNQCLEKIKEKYSLDGFTIRCFDLLNTIKTTSCLSLALFNSNNIVATCEGDIPTMISMHIANKIAKQTGFQANPSRIDVLNKQMVFAHCTLPINMCESFSLDTHFESKIGVAVKGKLRNEKITIFKLSKDLKNYYVTTGRIIENLNEENLCRTQILIEIDDNIEYFLNRPYGNHHIIIYGDYKEKIINYMENK